MNWNNHTYHYRVLHNVDMDMDQYNRLQQILGNILQKYVILVMYVDYTYVVLKSKPE